MNICVLLAAAVSVVAAAGSPPPPDTPDITGLWDTGSGGGQVEIYHCGADLCGRLADAAALRVDPDQRDVRNPDRSLRDRPLLGLVVLRDFSGGPAQWRGGPVYDPQTGDGARNGVLRLREDGRLEVKGCVAFVCRTRIWTRAG
ncbi:MAG: DUF2147 domain-containing protein [Oceanicaulis sp.]|nr:DUF2147 domain-containing protein [Oceanicaulis sp.]